MNIEKIKETKNGYMDWYSGENFGLRLDVSSGKYSEGRLIELFRKYFKTKVNDRCFDRRKWYDLDEKDVIGFHGFKEGRKIRSSRLKGYFNKGMVTQHYVRTINDITRNRNFEITGDGEILHYEKDGDFKDRYFHKHLTQDSDNITIRKQTKMKHLDTEEHYHFSVWVPGYIKNTTYKDEDFSDDYQRLVGFHLRDIFSEYNEKVIRQIKTGNRKDRFTLDIHIYTYNEMTHHGRYYSSKRLQIEETNDTLDRRFIV